MDWQVCWNFNKGVCQVGWMNLMPGRKGEEITQTYSWGISCNDRALLEYFFLNKHQPPRLCSVDLPSDFLTLIALLYKIRTTALWSSFMPN